MDCWTAADDDKKVSAYRFRSYLRRYYERD